MRARDFIIEAQRNRVILVDFQPAYATFDPSQYDPALSNAIEYINKRNPQVLAFYNGMDVGIEDTKEEVYEHYVDFGMNPNANIEFREKGYGFLRSWMDSDVPPGAIIRTIREMNRQGVNDSRDLFPDEDDYEYAMEQFLGSDFRDVVTSDPLYLPEVSIAELKTFSNALMGGGGRHECLRELNILMSAYNIRAKLVESWMYG